MREECVLSQSNSRRCSLTISTLRLRRKRRLGRLRQRNCAAQHARLGSVAVHVVFQGAVRRGGRLFESSPLLARPPTAHALLVLLRRGEHPTQLNTLAASAAICAYEKIARLDHTTAASRRRFAAYANRSVPHSFGSSSLSSWLPSAGPSQARSFMLTCAPHAGKHFHCSGWVIAVAKPTAGVQTAEDVQAAGGRSSRICSAGTRDAEPAKERGRGRHSQLSACTPSGCGGTPRERSVLQCLH